ncbi:camp-regulated phosphoprotein/endosulfine conserved region-domain-containing protein [Bombardia bombarda]|uniref:mRNA stability protein n=1 Tax=Bombardia bombarda TaxID=252184 RepID=A0AA40C494_9PEZI|nr:camp-regulated phosphoprotein/endosulfine conserved region-domain-containing protein [Bombardia bombarda]
MDNFNANTRSKEKASIDVSSLSPEELRLYRLYGRVPSQTHHFSRHLKERKYFDSGDYALSKAGKGNSVDVGAVGSLHPVPQNIPHPSATLSPSSSSLSPPPTTRTGAMENAGLRFNILAMKG